MICLGARKMYSYAVNVKSFGSSPNPLFMISDSLENEAETIRTNGSRQNSVKIVIAVYEIASDHAVASVELDARGCAPPRPSRACAMPC